MNNISRFLGQFVKTFEQFVETEYPDGQELFREIESEEESSQDKSQDVDQEFGSEAEPS